jgi:hypothetical protein
VLKDAEAMLESMRDDVDIWEEEAENSSNLRRGSFQVTSAAAKDAASPLVAPLHSAAGKKEYASSPPDLLRTCGRLAR